MMLKPYKGGPPKLRRSALFMPGSNPRALVKATTLPCDVVIMDLEDAVAPASKAQARAEVGQALRQGDYGWREVAVRVNPVDSAWFEEDLAALAGLHMSGVVLPKVESVAQLTEAEHKLRKAGLDHLGLWIMVETPRGVLDLSGILGSQSKVDCVALGTADLSKALRLASASVPACDPERAGLQFALAHCVCVARAHRVMILDGVHFDLRDQPGLERACAHARQLGFDGKTLVHPNQISAANEAFAPTPEEVAKAKTIINAWKNKAPTEGVTVVAGVMVEQLHVDEANRLLQIAREAEKRQVRV